MARSGPIDSTSERFSHLPDRVFNLESQTFRNRDCLGQEFQPNAGPVDATFCNVVIFPDGDAQVTGCHRPVAAGRVRAKASEDEKAKTEADRARRELLTVCKYYRLDHMWTATYRGAMKNRQRLYRDLHKFERIVRKTYPQFRQVGVPEVHHGGGVNDGGYHYHFGVNGFYEVEVLRSAWWTVVGEAMGNVQVESRCTQTTRAVALYLVKYMVKEFKLGNRLKGEHRYRRSHGLDVPVIKKRFYGGRAQEREKALRVYLTMVTGKPVAFEWRSEDGLQFMLRTFR